MQSSCELISSLAEFRILTPTIFQVSTLIFCAYSGVFPDGDYAFGLGIFMIFHQQGLISDIAENGK